MGYRLLHIMPDEKVVDTFISMMEEVYPDESLFAIYGKADKPSRVKSARNVVYFRSGSRDFRRFLRQTSSFSRIILHFIDSSNDFRVLNHPDISGLFWGADLYESLLARKGYQIYLDEAEMWKVRAGKKPVWLYKTAIHFRDYFYYRRELALLGKLRRLGAQECDARQFYLFFPNYHFEKVSPGFTYYPLEKMISPTQLGRVCYGHDIWVNNSSALNGNHTSIFNLLSSFKEQIKIITPLSYGDPRCINYIEKQGRSILGSRFIPLKEFLPTDRYYQLFLSANSFVFGHLRQCGYGNILVALYFGGKCFFYKRNPILEELRNQSFVVFTIEDDLTEDFALAPLSDRERNSNREIVLSICSREKVLQRLHDTFE